MKLFIALVLLSMSGCSVCDFYPAGDSHCARYYQCKKEGKHESADGNYCE